MNRFQRFTEPAPDTVDATIAGNLNIEAINYITEPEKFGHSTSLRVKNVLKNTVIAGGLAGLVASAPVGLAVGGAAAAVSGVLEIGKVQGESPDTVAESSDQAE